MRKKGSAEEFLDEAALEEFSKMLHRPKTHEDFIAMIDSAVVFNMTTAEYNEIAEDIRELASTNKKVMARKIKAVADGMDIGSECSREDMQAILKNISSLKNHDFQKTVHQGTLSLLCQILTTEYEDIYKGRDLLNRNIGLMRFLLANDLKVNLPALIARPEFEKLPAEVLFLIRDVVYPEAMSRMLETLKSRDLHNVIHSLRASAYQGKRWEPLNRLYEAALSHADNLWAGGSALTRNQMAEHLTSDQTLIEKYGFHDLNYDRLRDMLGPIAAKHGKLPPRGRPRVKSK